MSKDWREPHPDDYEMTIGGLRTGSEILADLDDERETSRERLERHGPGPVSLGRFPCGNCGARSDFYLPTCPLCGDERRAA